SLECKKSKPAIEKPRTHSKAFVSSNLECALCKQLHYLSKCDRFHQLTAQERLAKAKDLKVCLNCLSKGHFVTKCCSFFTCRLCKSKHHTSLHLNSIQSTAPTFTPQLFLLPTASARIIDSLEKLHTIRILLDSGSQSNFIKCSLSKKLNLPVESVNISVSGLAQAASLANAKCAVEVHAHQSCFKAHLSCLVLDEITGIIPYLDNVKFSEPSFYKPGDIDLLIGASAFFSILCIGQIRLGPNLPILQRTRSIGFQSDVQVLCYLSRLNDLPDQLNRFWELEHYPENTALSSGEKACEDHFSQNTRRSLDGRFIVSIAFKEARGLFSILIRFRHHRYAISADIENMSRQVLVECSQRALQRILWRSSPADSFKCYNLNTVTYGTASALFLAMRALCQLGINCVTSFSEISLIIKSDCYVDDLLTGCDNLAESQRICSELANILKAGCFNLRKWDSNDSRVLKDIPASDIHPSVRQFGVNEHTSTL
ncbi:hypothetical protein YQE_00387, partial [Dendroctonus ponderosae]